MRAHGRPQDGLLEGTGAMKKPHEQEWKVQGNGVVAVSAAVVVKVEVAPWRLPPPDMDDWEMAAKVSQDVTTLIAAAPEMARALMGPSGKGHHAYNTQRDEYACHRCAYFAPHHSIGCDFGDALRKAGVL